MKKDQERPLDPPYEEELKEKDVSLTVILEDIALTEAIQSQRDAWEKERGN